MSAPRCSVLTSSSLYSLTDLIPEVASIGCIGLFDIMLLRDTDIRDIEKEGIVSLSFSPADASEFLGPRSITDLMAYSPWEGIADWIIRQFRPGRHSGRPGGGRRIRDVIADRIARRSRSVAATSPRIAAFATYYPEITSISPERRTVAISALANTVRIALKLCEVDLMEQPIVEIVCGQILDPCACDACKEDPCVLIASRPEKFEYLLESCRSVVKAVGEDKGFGLALELEPGETYVLNDADALGEILDRVRDCPLRSHVGLNMDIAHMKIAGVKPGFLKKYQNMIMHAHVADTPGVHTRDHVVGTWVPVQQGRGSYHPYLELLSQRGISPTICSNTVALEIEGNNRIDWIYRSLNAMKHLVESVA